MADRNKDVNRSHDASVMAIHRETGKIFGGKARGTSTGYSKKQYLKAAMTEAKVNHEDYYFISISITPYAAFTVTHLEGELPQQPEAPTAPSMEVWNAFESWLKRDKSQEDQG